MCFLFILGTEKPRSRCQQGWDPIWSSGLYENGQDVQRMSDPIQGAGTLSTGNKEVFTEGGETLLRHSSPHPGEAGATPTELWGSGVTIDLGWVRSHGYISLVTSAGRRS